MQLKLCGISVLGPLDLEFRIFGAVGLRALGFRVLGLGV